MVRVRMRAALIVALLGDPCCSGIDALRALAPGA